MCKIKYYYNPIVEHSDCGGFIRYSVNYYVSDGKYRFYAGTFNGDTPAEALSRTRDVVQRLNEPRKIFGFRGRIAQWIWWRKRIKKEK